ncbi:MAG: hypothetical protein MUF54_05885 [Polyangiaceae bacterium]|jgi:hypothetical protein|nr:hypothetical protein [Polyangiaceae bacterium]
MPHARLHYDESLEPIARRVADLFEDLHDSMAEELGWSPSQSVEIVLVDSSDSANGSASAFPYNTIRLFVTAPDDMSPLGDHDDWHLELVSHEFTHVLHTDNITGAPAVVNAVLGRTLIPNQAQPRWILEGFAVINESRYSTGGRMRSSMFDMFLRADVLDDRMMGLDQISNSPRRWPQGNVWYLYGSRFLGWIVDTYGYGVLPAIASDTGAQLIPYGLNRSVRRATGATYVELYDAWKAHLRRHYGTQMARVQARGLREGKRLTFEGESAGRPRFVPRAARTSTGTAQVMLHRATSHDPSGFYRLTLDSHTAVRSEELVVRAEGNCSGSFAPDGSFIYSALEPWKRTYFFNDLHRLPSDETAPTGLEPGVQRLTHGHRAHEPDISPDGRHVVYTVNHRGTSYLKIANITPEGGIELPRTLVPSAVFEQAYTPRFSPDGRHVAYSVWTRGGYRDIRIVEVTTGKFRQLMRDRAMDMQPVFSPDGHYLLYVSDRTGIANVYAHDLTSDTLHQVTNVRTGAYQPELSPDGKTLLYVGYTSEGFDLFVMTFEPRTFLQPLPYRAERPARPVEPRHRSYEKRPYNPLPSLRPRALSFRYGPGTFGQALAIETEGRDAVGHHSILLSANIESEQIMPYASASYAYDRLPFRYVSSLFSSLAPRRGYRVNDQELVWLERSLGWSNSFVYGQPRAFDSQTYALTYSIARVDGDLPVGDALDPYAEATSDPLRGNIGVLRAAWSYSNAQRFGYSVGPEYGFTLSAAVDVGNELTASEYSVYALSYRSTAYGRMPWHRHHSVALHLGGGTATGNYPRRGLYYVGGFADTPVHDLINNSVFQGGFVLRGYKPVSFIGSQYHLANVEYRFPIAVVDRGISTLPAYLQRISGNLFIDYGGAFNKLDIENWRDHFHTGIGAEVWVDAQVGYYTLLNVRLGYAKGYGQAAEEGGQKYLVVAAPF